MVNYAVIQDWGYDGIALISVYEDKDECESEVKRLNNEIDKPDYLSYYMEEVQYIKSKRN